MNNGKWTKNNLHGNLVGQRKGKKKSSEKILLGLLLVFTCYPILTRSGVFFKLFKNKNKIK